MAFKIYSLLDEKSCKFNPLQLMYTHEDAVRTVKDIVQTQPGSLVAKFHEDFKLYYIGDFDDSTGVITPLAVPELVCSVSECVVKPNS